MLRSVEKNVGSINLFTRYVIGIFLTHISFRLTALWSPALSDLQPEGQKVITYERDFLLQLQSIPTCLLRPEGLPDYECVLGNKQTPSKPE